LLADPSLRRAMGQNGYDRVHTHFRWTHIMDRYMDVYQTAITRHHAAHVTP